MTDFASYSALFASAFLSATLLPGSSEVVLLAMLAKEQGNAVALVSVATAGNVAGSTVNWLIGRFLMHFRDRRWFPVDADQYESAARWYARYGVWTLLLSWLPIVGDPLTLVAGAFRTGFGRFLLLVTAGKAARYLFIAGAFLTWSS